MEAKIDNTDVEGQFARPDIFDKKGVMGRMDNKFPFHPLERSEAMYVQCQVNIIPLKINLFLRYNKNVEQSEMHMLRRTMGMAMPMKLAMEKKVNQICMLAEPKYDLIPGCE